MKEAARYNEGKPKLSYFMRSFRKMNEAIARIKEFGAAKYEEDNWRLGNKPDVEYLDSLFRHLDLFLSGEVYDQDSGCHHLGHAVWNLSALLELNYGDTLVIDEKLFRERMQYWINKKKEKPSFEPFVGTLKKEAVQAVVDPFIGFDKWEKEAQQILAKAALEFIPDEKENNNEPT